MKRKLEVSELIFKIISYVFLTIFAICCLYPFLYAISAAISGREAVEYGQIVLFPKDVQFEAFANMFNNNMFWNSYTNTLFITFYGTLWAMLVAILGGYALSAIFTIIGYAANLDALKILNVQPFTALVANGVTLNTFLSVPDFTFLTAFKGLGEINASYISTIAVAYIPVAFVVFAEHLADHKNISSIIDTDLLKDPGLHRTLLGDGVGSMAGAFFGGCPNTTYGESVGCVAISGNASVVTIITAAIICIVAAFFAPLMTLLATIPSCVMGGVCVSLYGFIAVSGLKMIQKVDLSQNHNLFTVSVILIAGVGGMVLNIGKITITSIACALILGILTNLLTLKASKKAAAEKAEEKAE